MGVLDTGCYPLGVDAMASAIADDFSTAGFSAFAAGDVMRQKYAKLLLNLYNVLQSWVIRFCCIVFDQTIDSDRGFSLLSVSGHRLREQG